MTEEFENENRISKTEAFLTFIVLASCENLSPWAENLQIVRRCCESISRKAFQDNNELKMIMKHGGLMMYQPYVLITSAE